MLTVASNPPEAGNVEVSPKKTTYAEHDSVTLTAIPLAGYLFENWTGDIEGIENPNRNPVAFFMGDAVDNNRSIIANFAASSVRYRVAAGPATGGGGSVALVPDWSDYPVNQRVSVYAAAETGYIFSHWEGNLTGTDSRATLLLDGNKTVAAIFNANVTAQWDPVEGGTVQLSPGQTPNGYSIGTLLTVEAKARKGYKFKCWDGDLSGSHKTATVTVNGPTAISALFVEKSGISWWFWLVCGVVGLVAVLILLRLAQVKMMSRE